MRNESERYRATANGLIRNRLIVCSLLSVPFISQIPGAIQAIFDRAFSMRNGIPLSPMQEGYLYHII